MTFTASDVFKDASITLNDGNFVRWTLPELLGWLNLATKQIAVAKPSATASTIEVELQRGTLQALPQGYHQLLAVNRNLVERDDAPGGRAGGAVITPASKVDIDSFIPNWHDPSYLPYNQMVGHVVDHDSDPSAFFVVPGNLGTGVIEVVASRLPADIPLPSSPNELASYSAVVDVPDAYRSAVLNFVLAWAFAKDINLPGAAQRSQTHLALFNEAVGIKAALEKAENVNAPQTRFSR
jgi:hypothetical protein